MSSSVAKRLYLQLMMAIASGSVSQYLSHIESNTTKYFEYFALLNLPEPSYDASDGINKRQTPSNDTIAFKDAAIEAADELYHLHLDRLYLILISRGDVGALFVRIRSLLTTLAIIYYSVCSTFTGTK